MKNTSTRLHPALARPCLLLLSFTIFLTHIGKAQEFRIAPAPGGRVQLINSRTGLPLLERSFIEIETQPNGFFRWFDESGFGFFNAQGRLIADILTFTQTRNFSAQRAIVKQNGKWGCIDENGQPIIPFI
ncbi:MAG TPA: WG repeat-containing protein, partial [Ferruginibacter sp.]|nr:WG repeat-containing protein [Ferruginibacter sp.]